MFTREEFGRRLRMLRERSGETQKGLAVVLGVSEVQISYLESGKRITTFEKLSLICQHYQVSADYLLGLREGP